MTKDAFRSLIDAVRSDHDVVIILNNGREQKAKAPLLRKGELWGVPMGRVTMWFEVADVSAVQTIEPKPGV